MALERTAGSYLSTESLVAPNLIAETGLKFENEQIEFIAGCSTHMNLLVDNAIMNAKYPTNRFPYNPTWTIKQTKDEYVEHIARILTNMLPGICCYESVNGDEKELFGSAWRNVDPEVIRDITLHYCHKRLYPRLENSNTAQHIMLYSSNLILLSNPP
jgi:hypothetical protein